MMLSEKLPVDAAQKVFYHRHFPHFLLYCLTYMMLGQIITCLGPLFPYLAEAEKRSETEYSILLSPRALGFVIGSLLIKFIGQKISFHHFIGFGILLMSIFTITFSFTDSLYLRGLFIGLASIGCSFQEITLNLAALECFQGEDVATWLQVIHGFFGIGGLLGPIVVYFFELNTMTFLGFTCLVTAVLYFYLESPEKMANEIRQSKVVEKKLVQIPRKSVILLSACFFFAVGLETTFGGWISSYAVLNGFSSKQKATWLSSLFWISITAFRIILAFTKSSSSKKIEKLTYIGVVGSFVSIFLIWCVNPIFGMIMMSIIYGLCGSVMFPLLLTIPEEFGFKFNVSEGSTFITWASLGEGCLAVLVGKMMGWISYETLIYSILIFNIVIFFANKMNYKYLQGEKERYSSEGRIDGLMCDEIKEIEMKEIVGK